MKIVCCSEGGNRPDCTVEHLMNRFEFRQGDHSIILSSAQSVELEEALAAIEAQAVELLHEKREELSFDELRIETDDLGSAKTVRIEASESRLAYAVCIQDGKGCVLFDVDEAWGVRVILAEARRQESDGVYDGWV